jgi:hypothetical protein
MNHEAFMKPVSFGTTLRLIGDKLVDITNCPCENPKCQDCCEHWEVDHFICMDCEKEMDPGEAIDRAMD